MYQPGMYQPGMMQPGMMQPGMMQPGMMQPGMMQPGMMQPGMMQPGMMQPGMMQPGMMQPGMMQPGMMQPGMMMPIMTPPVYKQIKCGKGIDSGEFQKIVNACTTVYQTHQKPLGEKSGAAIKQMMNGEWLVVTHPADKSYDFALTTVKGGDFLAFSLDNTLFQVCRLK